MQCCPYCNKVFDFIVPTGEIVLCIECENKFKILVENIPPFNKILTDEKKKQLNKTFESMLSKYADEFNKLE